MKTCNKCGEDFPLAAFNKKGFYRNGTRRYNNSCKSCHAAQSRELHSASRERNLERMRQDYLANREARLDYRREQVAKTSTRCVRIKALMRHFQGREGWLKKLADIVANRPDVTGLAWLSADIEDLLITYVYDEV